MMLKKVSDYFLIFLRAIIILGFSYLYLFNPLDRSAKIGLIDSLILIILLIFSISNKKCKIYELILSGYFIFLIIRYFVL